MLADRYDLPLSTVSAAARDAYVQGCDLALTLYPGAVETFDCAIADDLGFALAYAGKGKVLMRGASDGMAARRVGARQCRKPQRRDSAPPAASGRSNRSRR